MLVTPAPAPAKLRPRSVYIPSQSSLRGHSKKLYKKRLKKDVKKYSFPDRAIDKWNALPEVVCVKSIHGFKEKYDEMMSKYGT